MHDDFAARQEAAQRRAKQQQSYDVDSTYTARANALSTCVGGWVGGVGVIRVSACVPLDRVSTYLDIVFFQFYCI
jgi:hypothetical protein